MLSVFQPHLIQDTLLEPATRTDPVTVIIPSFTEVVGSKDQRNQFHRDDGYICPLITYTRLRVNRSSLGGTVLAGPPTSLAGHPQCP